MPGPVPCRQWASAVALLLVFSLMARADDDGRILATLERVPRNRAAAVAVRRVVDAMKSTPDADVLRVAQMVLDIDTDSFTSESLPVRATIEDQLRSSVEAARKYDLLVGGDADKLLKDADSESSIQKLRLVTRRYYLTAAGYAASERLLAILLDSGEYEMASRLATQVLNEPAHRPRITRGFKALAENIRAFVDDKRDPARVSPSPDAVRFQEQVEKFRDALMPLAADWNQMGGSASHSRIILGSAPVPVAAWSTEYARSSGTATALDFLEEWEGSRKDLEQPACPAAYPIIVRNQMIFRDMAGVRAVQASTGKPIWSARMNHNPSAVSGRTEAMIRRQMRFGVQGVPNSFGENSTMGAISSDGRRVYVVDSTGTDDELVEFENTGQYVRLLRNRLVAVQATGETAGQTAWINPGAAPMGPPKQAGPAPHMVFLGPPLPGTTELLCITEVGDEVHLTAIAPESGKVMWSQPLSMVERIEKIDLERYETACVPARADGIVVCPTNSGLLVGVDQVRMNLLWARFVDEVPEPRRAQFRPNGRQQSAGYPAYASHVKIANGRILYLPPRSSQLHCLELTTGQIQWSVARKDAEYVGAIADGQVLVVGRMGCRSLAIDDGHEIWTAKTGMPAGQGVAIGSQFVLPLDGGRMAAIDLKTGKDQSTDILRSDVPLGHLAADRGQVYSLGHRSVAAFRQIDPVLATARVNDPDAGLSRDIALAEVAMAQGRLGNAAAQLRRVLSNASPSTDRDRARRRLKDVLFAKITRDSDAAYEDYETLDELLDSPADELRFLIAAASSPNIPSGKLLGRMGERAYNLPPDVTAPAVSGNDDWMISPTVWCRLQLEQPNGFGGQLKRLLVDSLRNGDQSIDGLKRFVRVFDSKDEVVPARRMLAARMEAELQLHSAETLLLRNRASNDREVAADATVRLMRLWEESGVVNDAARQYNLLLTDFADTTVADRQTGSQFARKLPADRPARLAWNMNREPAWPVSHVEIRQLAAKPEFTESVVPIPANAKGRRLQSERQEFSVSGRSFIASGQIELLTSAAESDDEYMLSIIDHRARLRRGTLIVPAKHRMPIPDRLYAGGHLLPVGVPGGIMGISLIQLGDGEPAWKHQPVELAGRKAPPSPGPSGPGFASYLWHNRLFVVDPLDGALLWHRQVPTSFPDANLDLTGDGRALAVQIPEQVPPQSSERRIYYEVYDTATGRKISTVRTGFNTTQWQGAYGRFVMGFADLPEGRRLQIRDLLKEQPEISELVSDAARQPFLMGGELFYMGSGGEIRIFDIANGRKTLSVQLDVQELQPVGAIRVLSDRTRYFINLQRHTPTATTAHFNQPLNNSQIPGYAIRDDIYAFNKKNGEFLWKRSIPYRTILQFPECQMPFMVLASVIKDRVNNAQQSLTVEVIDSATGVTIGYRQDLAHDSFLTANYDGERGRILLKGQSTDVELRFGPAEGQSGAQ
jgi:outer membrane protein assembly factor BamB